MDCAERTRILANVAQQLCIHRADLMGAALAEGGKLLTESDPEVSEAVDFVRYYSATARDLAGLESIEVQPRGVVVVVPPWNFPIAIPCGGVAAALAAGNTVILKPASHTVLVAWELCQCFWRAGVPREVLQFVPCSGATGGAQLVASELADLVILTGGTDTALRMLEARPQMDLLAETGGKNATIVTAMSDREQAIAHVVRSAFGHGGQKCSATSLLILEDEVYEDEGFRETLCDAARSLRVGSAWELDTRLGPLVHRPGGDLERALKELEPGESWALMPTQVDGNPCLYSPGIKWGVKPGSYTHLTEFFGPVLAVMRARDLREAITLVNQTGYGLTSGLQSLDEREQSEWREDIRAGNLYINRMTTGAIVHRQPFGGVGKSAFGPGIKAGGPNYVAQLMDIRDRQDGTPESTQSLQSPELEALREALLQRHPADAHPPDLVRLLRAMSSYEQAYLQEFSAEHDDFKLLGQDNIRRYRPVSALRVRIHAEDSAFEIFARVCAARTVGCRTTVSVPVDHTPEMVALLDRLTQAWGAVVEFVEESDAELASLIAAGGTQRVRYAAPERVPEVVLKAVGDTGVYIARAPVLMEGRAELLWYVTEQSISHDYHRYGNLGGRAQEERAAVA
jgi:RHH-type proline utilization regulon transcriptional repressor/proline dehydrogenase/delta 1-pyrroline-5-carboxylate dehydrogenase